MTSSVETPANRTSLIVFGCKDIGLHYWAGNANNGAAHYIGQTFLAPVAGYLTSIKIFVSLVFEQANVTLALHEFDKQAMTWKQKLTEAVKPVTKTEESQWVSFTISSLKVNKDTNYGFKITINGSGLIAVAECPFTVIDPYPGGVQWTGTSVKPEGSFHRDFDVAFEGTIDTAI